MKDIDWSEAPEGATHVGIDGCDDIQWYKNILPNGGYHYWACEQWNKTVGTPISKGITPRPTQWQGPQDGDPPVGTAVRYPTGQGVVRLESDLDGVLIVEEDGLYKRVAADGCQPIQSERDKVIELAMEMFKPGLTKTWMEMLYDAGMLVDPERKPMSRAEAYSTLSEMRSPYLTEVEIDAILCVLGYKE